MQRGRSMKASRASPRSRATLKQLAAKETADRLQRHLGGERRRVSTARGSRRPGTHLTVLRQVTSGLAHQPHGRRRQNFACEQDGFGFLRSPDANYLPGPDDIYVSP